MRRLMSAWSLPGGWGPLVLLMTIALTFSVVVGNYLVRLYEPAELGSSVTGEWADLSDYGFRMRLDEMVMAPSFPSSWDENELTAAPDGMELLRIRLSIEPLVGPDADMACRFELFNGDGEQLGLTESVVEGPSAVDCNVGGDEPREPGVVFVTQLVHVVIPEPLENYSLQMYPLSAESQVYWTFTP